MDFQQLMSFCDNKKAVKYNGYQLDNNSNTESKKAYSDNKYALNTDYLNINLKGIPLFQSELLTLDFADYGTQVFKQMCEVTFKNVHLGTLYFEPRSTALKSDLVQLKISNELFYIMSDDELKILIKEFLQITTLKFDSINRFDIALDFSGAIHGIDLFIRALNLNMVRLSGRSKAFKVHATTNNGYIDFQGFELGKRSNSRFLRCYNKTIENLQGKTKLYLTDLYEKIGFDNTEDSPVWRFEYQLNNQFFKTYPITFDDIFNSDYRYSLLVAAQTNHFSLKWNTGKKETNKEEDFNFFDWFRIRKVLRIIGKKLVKLKRVIKESVIGQQRIVKALIRSYVSS